VRCAGRPTVGADFARSRQRVGPPKDLAGLSVESGQPSAYAELSPSNAAVYDAVVIEWSTGDAIAIAPIFDCCLPHLLASLDIEGNNIGIELAQENFALAHRQPAVQPAAANCGDRLLDARPALPQGLASLRIQREHVIVTGDDIHDAVLHQRRRFGRILAAHPRPLQTGHPGALQLLHIVGINLFQRRITLVGQVAAIGDPVLADGTL